MPAWYLAFIAAVALVCLTASERDRVAARIVAASTLAGLLAWAALSGVSGAWKLSIYGGIETATILALLALARNRSGLWQAAALTVSWAAHWLCFADVQLGTSIIYDTYSEVLALVAAAQVAGFHDTLGHLLRRLIAAGMGVARFVRRGAVRGRGGVSRLLPRARHARAQPLPPPCQTTPSA